MKKPNEISRKSSSSSSSFFELLVTMYIYWKLTWSMCLLWVHITKNNPVGYYCVSGSRRDRTVERWSGMDTVRMHFWWSSFLDAMIQNAAALSSKSASNLLVSFFQGNILFTTLRRGRTYVEIPTYPDMFCQSWFNSDLNFYSRGIEKTFQSISWFRDRLTTLILRASRNRACGMKTELPFGNGYSHYQILPTLEWMFRCLARIFFPPYWSRQRERKDGFEEKQWHGKECFAINCTKYQVQVKELGIGFHKWVLDVEFVQAPCSYLCIWRKILVLKCRVSECAHGSRWW